MEYALDKTDPGEFTGKIWPLENRRFYKPSFTDRKLDDE